MKTVTEYHIIQADTLSDLTRLVTEFLEAGWIVQGDVLPVYGNWWWKPLVGYCQAMIRITEQPGHGNAG